MSHDQFPAYRLVTLIMRQISSPIATRITRFAKVHPVFSQVVCVRACEAYRRVEWRTRALALRAAGRRDAWAARHPPPLPLSEAQQTGADLLSEALLFTLLASIITYEVNRQADLKEAKLAKERRAWLSLLDLLKDIEEELKEQQLRIDRLREMVHEIETGSFPSESPDEDKEKHTADTTDTTDTNTDTTDTNSLLPNPTKALQSILLWIHPSLCPSKPSPPPPAFEKPRPRQCDPECCKDK